VRRQRLYAFLARRGFNPDEIRGVMTSLGEALDA
jgi:SOS response regulatory protein OraA/RecX